MFGYIIIAIIIVFSIGYIISSWISSKIIVKQESLIDLYKTKLINLQDENDNLQIQVKKYKDFQKSYPTYSSQV